MSGSNAAKESVSRMDIHVLAGEVKWFDPSKRYGFIRLDGDLPDALLHADVLHSGGFQVVREGARVRCEVISDKKGPKAVRVLDMDMRTAVPAHANSPRAAVTPESDWEDAIVKWYNTRRGYGFLDLEEGDEQVFVHAEEVRKAGLIELRPLQSVQVRYGQGERGLRAVEIRLKPVHYGAYIDGDSR